MAASARTVRRLNGWATLVWLALGVPTFVLWLHSVAWIVGMSWWALVASHSAAWVAGRAEEKAEE
jgi:hypothetical protein